MHLMSSAKPWKDQSVASDVPYRGEGSRYAMSFPPMQLKLWLVCISPPSQRTWCYLYFGYGYFWKHRCGAAGLPSVALLLHAEHFTSFFDCVSLMPQMARTVAFLWESPHLPPPCFLWVYSQVFSNRADVIMISSDLAPRQHPLSE